ncbi:MAG: Fic family protein [Bacteroidales bacterium]|jgi:Fic family protein|nr:Fic family protein [Bacteroidales bacterium]
MEKIQSEFLRILNQYNDLGISDALNYEQMNEILISHHSTAIEGSSLTLEESRLLLSEGITAKGKPLEDHNMVKDHYQALRWAIEQAKQKADITPKFIQQMSARVMKNTGKEYSVAAGNFDSSKGDWRKISIFVGARYFTSYQKIELEVTKLVDIINERNKAATSPVDVYDLAFDAHFGLVSIHPFADGNGRTSRLLMNYILAAHNLPLAVIFKEDRKDYFDALEASRSVEQINLVPFREFMYSQQIKFFKNEIILFEKGTKEIDIATAQTQCPRQKVNENA